MDKNLIAVPKGLIVGSKPPFIRITLAELKIWNYGGLVRQKSVRDTESSKKSPIS
jgi:hypothetical protein